MLLEAALIASRFLHDAGALGLFGAALFPFYSFRAGEAWPDAVVRWRSAALMVLAALALVGAVCWMFATAANMGGDAASALAPDVWSALFTDSDFGWIWCARLALGAVLLLAALTRWQTGPLFAGLAGLYLASLAGVGHTRVQEGAAGLLHVSADAVHLLAAGAWIGALFSLGWMAARLPAAPGTTLALRRFSGIGQTAVALLILTGVANAVLAMDHPLALFATTYGCLLALKLMLVTAMLAIAAMNRFVLVPQLTENDFAVSRLRWHIAGEQFLAIGVVVVVAILGMSDPTGG